MIEWLVWPVGIPGSDDSEATLCYTIWSVAVGGTHELVAGTVFFVSPKLVDAVWWSVAESVVGHWWMWKEIAVDVSRSVVPLILDVDIAGGIVADSAADDSLRIAMVLVGGDDALGNSNLIPLSASLQK